MARRTAADATAIVAFSLLLAIAVGPYANLRENQTNLARERIPTMMAPEEGGEIQPGMHARLYLLAAEQDIDRIKAYYKARFDEGIATEGLMLDRKAKAVAVGSDAGEAGAGELGCHTWVLQGSRPGARSAACSWR